jgi:hypothetical protein
MKREKQLMKLVCLDRIINECNRLEKAAKKSMENFAWTTDLKEHYRKRAMIERMKADRLEKYFQKNAYQLSMDVTIDKYNRLTELV